MFTKFNRNAGEKTALTDPPKSVPLLQTGTCKVEPLGAHGRTLLMKAAEAGNLADVKVLAEHSRGLNAVDSHGETALMMAAAIGNLDAVQILLDAGADASIATPYGWTALRFAKELGAQDVVGLLEEFSPAGVRAEPNDGPQT